MPVRKSSRSVGFGMPGRVVLGPEAAVSILKQPRQRFHRPDRVPSQGSLVVIVSAPCFLLCSSLPSACLPWLFVGRVP